MKAKLVGQARIRLAMRNTQGVPQASGLQLLGLEKTLSACNKKSVSVLGGGASPARWYNSGTKG
jgi:hypothetical protein